MYTKKLQGEGSPLLFLHGWGQDHESLLPLAELMRPISRPILIDLPGFGNTPPPSGPLSAQEYADLIAKELEEVGPFSVVGHSFGGKVAICLAARYPERVKKLVLMASSGLRPKRPFLKKIKFKGISLVGKALKKYDKVMKSDHFRRTFAPRFGSADYKNAPEGTMRTVLVKSVNEEVCSEAAALSCKTLLLWGKEDRETPPEIGERLNTLIAGSKFFCFPFKGHQLMAGAGAHLLAAYITDFLEEGK